MKPTLNQGIALVVAFMWGGLAMYAIHPFAGLFVGVVAYLVADGALMLVTGQR